MKKFKALISYILMCAILVGLCPAFAQAASTFPSETDPFVKNYYVGATDQEKPFFDVILPEIQKNIKANNKHSISPYYDKLPLANNPENFQGLGSTTYANINGKVVTAEAFYRVHNESLSDPNNGMGLLIYQCIQYKRAHPEEDVKITFSYYRTSATAAVCVLPESKYYGYMRSLYGTNYDEHGFVRISYMLTEAARMGIEVTAVNQLNSYAVRQYNPNTKSLKSRSPLSYVTYFERALETDCYDSYAPGKKVSDFMDFTKVGWTVEDKTGDMQHVKSATVSHYLATDGTEHRNAVFFGSANLDDNNYIGANGNNGAQSGVIVSDHAELYRVTYNYLRLMYDYRHQEGMFELRKLVNERNMQQAELIKSGRADEIPADEQIIYLGTENDPVFEMYFTPFGGDADVWDVENNPICKYVDKLPQSTDYIELMWNEYGYGKCHVGDTMETILEKAYCENPNPKNKISMRVTGFDTSAIQQLKLGSEIGYRSIEGGENIHSKDILLSYKENNTRHRVSLLTSCNFYMVAFNYRTNSLLVINETDKTGGNFYNIMGEKYSYGMINNDFMVTPENLVLEAGQTYSPDLKYAGNKTVSWSSDKKIVATVSKKGKITALTPGTANITVAAGKHKATIRLTVVECIDCYNKDEGLTCNEKEQYIVNKKYGSFPLTFESVFSVQKESLTGTTTLLGSDGSFDPALVFSLNKSGNPRVAIRNTAHYSDQKVYTFKKVNVATGNDVHLSITIDFSGKKMHCYVNGKLKQTLSISKISPYKEKHNMVIGGDHLNGNATHFTGTIKSISVWSDIRNKDEIASDFAGGINLSDKNLLASYDFTRCDNCMRADLSGNGYNLKHDILWQDVKDVEPAKDYAYSFAVIGDTQTMCEADPEAMESLYDWLIENKESEKIEYVIGLGDITDDSTDTEWEVANNCLTKLNGKIPYSLVRGNHDDWDDFNRNLHNGFYETTVDGMMVPGDVELTDPKQPGVVATQQPDGSITLTTGEGDTPEGGTVAGDLTNSCRYFNIQGTDYLLMTLDFAPNEATLEWANSVIAAHPYHRVIVTTHAYMYRDGTTLDAGDCYPPSYYKGYTNAQNGDDIWKKCLSKHENVMLVLSGHDPWQHVVYRQDKGVNGNVVTQMLIDPQYVDRKIGSTAMVAMLYFAPDGETVTVRYYSVARECYGSVASQFTINLNHMHSYSNACDANCNDCDAPRNVSHSYTRYEYNFDATAQKDGTKTAFCTNCGKKKTVTVSGSKLADSTAKFKDVPAKQWYKPHVDFAASYQIFSGTGSNTFTPNGYMTRAQFVQVFANLAGVDTSDSNVKSGFKDVPKNQWYTAAVKWAAENGIVSGMGDGKFAPTQKVTREQMCVMLINYIEKYQKKTLYKEKTVKPFADDKKISKWAKEYVYKCADAGLVNGVGDNKFAPAESATRAQGATLFTNFFKKYIG